MKKLTVFIEGRSKEITLDESIVISHDTYIYVKKAYVFWAYENIPTNFTAMTNNGNMFNMVNMYRGYYTFDLIKKLFKDGASLEATKYDGGCKIITDSSTTINITNTLANLLGFNDSNRTFNPNTTTTSDDTVNVNEGLLYIKIGCNIVERTSNLDEKSRNDDTIVSLPITTRQLLYGSVTEYPDIESKVKIDKGVINQLHFSVTDQYANEINVGKILLECYIM